MVSTRIPALHRAVMASTPTAPTVKILPIQLSRINGIHSHLPITLGLFVNFVTNLGTQPALAALTLHRQLKLGLRLTT